MQNIKKWNGTAFHQKNEEVIINSKKSNFKYIERENSIFAPFQKHYYDSKYVCTLQIADEFGIVIIEKKEMCRAYL